MANILHRILINAPAAKIYGAVSTPNGLKNWWTNEVFTDEKIKEGTIIKFRFANGGPDMRVTLLTKNKRVEWECIAHADEWLGTKFYFDIVSENGKNYLRFGQTGWAKESEFYMHCNCRWAYFMLSLKRYLETGEGAPYPKAIPM